MMIQIRDKQNLYKVLAIVSGTVETTGTLGLTTKEVQPVFVVIDRDTKKAMSVKLDDVEKVDV